jgi:CBS domain-containing protein
MESLDEDVIKAIEKNVKIISQEETIDKAIKTMIEHNIGGLLVMNKNLEGIVTERDILKVIE